MTDKELIKALRMCAEYVPECDKCPLYEDPQCDINLRYYTADRMEALLAENKKYSKMIYELNHENEVLRSQTIHLKAEQLPECMRTAPPSTEGVE